MTYAVTKFEVARSNGLGDTFTRNVTDPHTDVRAMDRLWYKINITLFSIDKSSIISFFVLLLYVPSQQLWSLRDGQFT